MTCLFFKENKIRNSSFSSSYTIVFHAYIVYHTINTDNNYNCEIYLDIFFCLIKIHVEY